MVSGQVFMTETGKIVGEWMLDQEKQVCIETELLKFCLKVLKGLFNTLIMLYQLN